MTEMCLSILAFAAAVTVPPMPVSPYADTEVSTNVAFNSVRSDVKEFELKFSFDGAKKGPTESFTPIIVKVCDGWSHR